MLKIEGLYRVLPLNPLRRTPGVSFDNVPLDEIGTIDAVDTVLHQHSAISPGFKR